MIHVFYMISMLDAIVPLYIKPSAIRPNDGTLNRTFGCIVKGNAILRLECAGMLGSHSRVLRYSFDGTSRLFSEIPSKKNTAGQLR